ncbi:hypothetical protein [Enterocloster bolteae]|uniref:hypothetical protein n=1 Tax=Enterocloster bolteae TaxID=208479 RepID=UPI002108B2A9|nr:hypothetical protein [Enterocloster bolteae]MCQ5144493.1 hypothetical protein [Enterocloster bolteae]
MKQKISVLLVLTMLCSLLFAVPVYAVGEGNLDNGGGGMGQGTSQNSWTPGYDGVRATVIRTADREPVTRPIDFTNKTQSSTIIHFGKVSKISYNSGMSLHPVQGNYEYTKPAQALPKIMSSQSLGQASIAEIKSYFTDEQVIRSIANLTGMDFNVLINGEYRLLIEPIAYVKFQGVKLAMTATEAALYDEQTGGAVRSRLPTVAFQNLPLAMFLEVADLGYPAWSGPTSGIRSNYEVKTALGLGAVRFNEVPPEAPEVSTYDYEYRTNTEVITSVNVSGGQSDPDSPVSVTFNVGGRSYTVNNVYYPDGDSQLAWIRWTTPDTPQAMTITVRVHGGGSVSKGTINVNIVDLDENPPSDPNADDRNDSFTRPPVPSNTQVTSAYWGVWRPWWQEHWVWHSGDDDDDGYWCDHGWWEFDLDRYSASLSGSMCITPDEKAPTASGRAMKSGYGFNEKVTTSVSTNQSSAVTAAQNAVTYFPEFQYQGFWRLLERMGGGYHMTHEFKTNRYSTYNRRTHFTPIWYPDGSYTPYTWLIDCWTPTGMLSMNLSDTITIDGNLWSDWHIAPQNPD